MSNLLDSKKQDNFVFSPNNSDSDSEDYKEVIIVDENKKVEIKDEIKEEIKEIIKKEVKDDLKDDMNQIKKEIMEEMINEGIDNEIKPIEIKEEDKDKEKNLNNIKSNPVDWPTVEITNITQDIKLYEVDNEWNNCKDIYGIDFYVALLNLYKTGKIFNKGIEYDFIAENYIETTNFKRSKVIVNNEECSVLIAGDILTFETEHFDFGIFVTEVNINGEITSRIDTSIYEQPKPSYIISDKDVFSTVKDTLGNCYVIKKKDENNNLTKQIYTFLNVENTIEPSNVSEYDPNSINNNNSDYNCAYYYNTLFNENRLFYNNGNLDFKQENSILDRVIIPNQDELAEKENPIGEIVDQFKCNIKGLFSVHRSKKVNDEPILQCMNFEICFDSSIESMYEDNYFIGVKNNFLKCLRILDGNTYINNYEIYLRNDTDNSSCFFSGGGFYNDNQYNDSQVNNKFYLTHDETNKFGFHIYSPYFFTDQPKPLTKKKIINKNNDIVYMENYQNEKLDLLKSIHISTNPNDKNNKGCSIV